MGYKDPRQSIGFGGHDAGLHDGYRPELDSLARAEYDAAVGEEGTPPTRTRLARIRRFLRRLFWEF